MKKDVNIKILMLFIVFTVFLIFSSLAVTASNETLDDLNLTSTYPIVDSYSDALVLFYSDTCPHCHEEIAFLNNEVKINYPGLKIKLFETSTSENRELFEKFAERYNSSSSGVPRTFINNKAFVGYSTENGTDEYVDSYKASIGFKNLLLEEVDVLAKVTNIKKENDVIFESGTKINPLFSFLIVFMYLIFWGFMFHFKKHKSVQYKRYLISGFVASLIISIFMFILLIPEAVITSFAGTLPFWLFTFIIALADGFNPCAFTVLVILLSLLTYTKSKKDMMFIGSIFIITSAIMYFLFIMIMILVGSVFIGKYGSLILQILGIFIVGAGFINLKDYLFFGKGISLTISNEEKSKIIKKARKIVQSLSDPSTSKWWVLGATIVLAIGVNIVELGCTAILPVVYMSTLIGKFGTSINFSHYFWTIFYSVIYILPLLAILGNFIFTFKSDRITEDQGRILKLLAGIFMTVCGMIMILKPELLMI